MQRTATHILSSPNPAQLEIRILANYGADRRFAFLRGRWSRSWGLVKAKVRAEQKAKESEKTKGENILGGLGDYGDSDESDDADSDTGNKPGEMTDEIKASQNDDSMVTDEEGIKAVRRLRAKEWAEKRRAVKFGSG